MPTSKFSNSSFCLSQVVGNIAHSITLLLDYLAKAGDPIMNISITYPPFSINTLVLRVMQKQ